jgi:RimJ/RimL family protein N-acetyltransferase
MIELQPFTKEDIPTLIGWIDSPEFLLQWGGPAFWYPLDEAQIRRQIDLTVAQEPGMVAYKAVDVGTGQIVGHIELLGIDRQNRSAYLGRVLVGPPHLRGKGVGYRMVQGALRVAFDELLLHRVELLVFDFNDKAIVCYERAGFQKEGMLREARRMGDAYWSLLRMSILEQEWRSLQRSES